MSNVKLAIKYDEIKDEKLIDFIKTYKKVFSSYLSRYISEMLGYQYIDEQITYMDGTEVTVKEFLKDLQENISEGEVLYIRMELLELLDSMIDYENTNIGVTFKLEIDKEQQELLKKLENSKKKMYLEISPYESPDIEWLRDEKNIEISNIENDNTTVEEVIKRYNLFKKYNEEDHLFDYREWKIAFEFLVKKRCMITNSAEITQFIKLKKWLANREFKLENAKVLIDIVDIQNFTEEDIKQVFEIGKKDAICLRADTIAEINDNIIEDLNVSYVEINKPENILSQKLSTEKYKKIRSILEQLVEGIDIASSEEQRFKKVYTKLAHMLTYDDEAAQDGTTYAEENAYKSRNLENGLLLGKCVCVGYAEILKQALSLAGIESHVILNGKHSWNVVKINGAWYNTDLTWDYEDIRNNLPPRFCLKSDEDFINECEDEEEKEDHEPDVKSIYKCEMPSMEIYPELKKNIIPYKIKKMAETIKSVAFKLLEGPKAIIKNFSRKKTMLPEADAEKEDNTSKEDFRASLTKDVPNQEEQKDFTGRKQELQIKKQKDNFEGR